jgi:branched-chain amino acid transport system permease protein
MSRPDLSPSALVKPLLFVVAALGVLFLPRVISDFRASELAYVAIYLIALLGLNILTGFTGQISLGHGAFMAIGAYTTAILISNSEPALKLGSHVFEGQMQDYWTIPLAGLVAGVIGFLFGFPALRLSGLYLALATFAVAIATPALIRRFDTLTGGGAGINFFDSPRYTGLPQTDPVTFEEIPGGVDLGLFTIPTFNEWLYYLTWSVALVMYVVAWALLRGRTGRALRAVRDSELAAVSSGVDLARYKTLAFGISAFYGGIAGSLYALANTNVYPDAFGVTLSIFLLVGVVVGGLGSLWPLVFGAIFIKFLPLWAQSLNDPLPDTILGVTVPDFRAPGAPAVVYGVILILIMIAFPGGAAGLFRRLGGYARRARRRAA